MELPVTPTLKANTHVNDTRYNVLAILVGPQERATGRHPKPKPAVRTMARLLARTEQDTHALLVHNAQQILRLGGILLNSMERMRVTSTNITSTNMGERVLARHE